MNTLRILLILLVTFAQVGYAQQVVEKKQKKEKKEKTKKPKIKEKGYKLRGIAELGFLGTFDHKIQFGLSNNNYSPTYFDYVKDGGQDNLFFNARLSLEFEFQKRNVFTFLYQPLTLQTQVRLNKSIQIDNVLFPSGTNLKLTYGFPFYRLSYLRYFVKNDKLSVGGGLSFQIRNADIRFESGDGSLLVASRNVGFVPALKFRMGYHFSPYASIEVEADGIYAPIRGLNGSDNDVIGSILDISVRQNFQLTKELKSYLTFRYIGGGAQGQSDNDDQITDGYSKNWLHFYAISVGFSYEFAWKPPTKPTVN
jgi:hypothetical protein